MKSLGPISMCVALSLAAWVFPCLAEEGKSDAADSAPKALTVDSCVDAALRFAEANGMFDAEVASSEAARRETHSGSMPHLNVTPEYRENFSGYRDSQFNVAADLGQRFLEVPQNIVRNRIARGQVGIAELRSRRLRIQYASRVMKAYVMSLRARQDLELSRGRLGMAEKEQVAWRHVTTVDRVVNERRERSLRETERLRIALADAEAMQGESNRQLRQLCGLGDVEVQLAELPPYGMPSVTLDSCLRWALTHRSDLAAAEREQALLAEGVRLANMDRLPRPRASFGYDSGGTDSDLNNNPQGGYAMLALEIPIWDAGETRARATQLAVKRDSLAIRIPELKSEISAGVSESYVRLRQAAGVLSAKTDDTAAEKVFREADVRFKLGGASPHEHEGAQLRLEAYRAEVQTANWACYEEEAQLLEALQATRADLAAGLPPSEAAAGP
jgi:outer membrane protein TolC